MIAERIEPTTLGVDVDRLRVAVMDAIAEHPPVWQSVSYGGWSVLSASGDYRDGWQTGHRAFDGEAPVSVAALQYLLKVPEENHVQPTEICHGYLADVLIGLEARGLGPFRARVALLRAGLQTSWHRDAGDDRYRVRLHIPLVTNEGCAFLTEEGTYHMALGGAYVVSVARWHQAVNKGATDRLHLLMGVVDTAGVTMHHRFTEAEW